MKYTNYARIDKTELYKELFLCTYYSSINVCITLYY